MHCPATDTDMTAICMKYHTYSRKNSKYLGRMTKSKSSNDKVPQVLYFGKTHIHILSLDNILLIAKSTSSSSRLCSCRSL